MNYYKARPLSDGSGYHYTCRNDNRISPVGYCSRFRECECRNFPTGCEKCEGGVIDLGEQYYKTHIHATPDEANACYRQYLLDGWKEETYGDWTGCEICDAPTKSGLTTRPPHGVGYPLCDEHRRYATLESLTTTPGTIISSS